MDDMTALANIKEENKTISRLDDSLYSKELAPHYMQLATKLASSELIPKSFRGKPQDLFICWAMGYQVGLSPEQSQQCIAVINGKPTMWGDDMLALCMSHKDFEDIQEYPIRNQDDTIIGYICTVTRKGKKPKNSEFTLEMAKRAGLLAKGGVWTQYPERMLKLRARGFCLRDSFPDALKGIKPREEVEDYIDVDYKIVDSRESRTELLKKDFLLKTDQGNSGENNALCEDTIHSFDSSAPKEIEKSRAMDSVGKKEITLHSEIKRLILEKAFAEDRLIKALHYYEVDCIDSLSQEEAEHFIEKLHKL